MTVVLTDQEIDRAEAFRLAKRYRLPPEVAVNSSSDVIRLRTFSELYGIEDTPIMQRIIGFRLRAGMAKAISSSGASYADRLSHIVDLDDPVTFVDLRAVVSPCPSDGGIPADRPCPDDPRSAVRRDGTAPPDRAEDVPGSG